MADGFVQIELDAAGKRVDTSKIQVGGLEVHRQRVVVSDGLEPGNMAAIKSEAAALGDAGLVVRVAPDPLPVGANLIGKVQIDSLPPVVLDAASGETLRLLHAVVTSLGENLLVAPTAGTRLVITHAEISGSGIAATLHFTGTEAATNVVTATTGSFSAPFFPRGGLNEVLNLNLVSGASARVVVHYFEE